MCVGQVEFNYVSLAPVAFLCATVVLCVRAEHDWMCVCLCNSGLLYVKHIRVYCTLACIFPREGAHETAGVL